MDVITVNYSPPPHPELPRNVPSHLKKVFSQCSRAAKMAWIAESGLAEFPAEHLTDKHLGKLYKGACRKGDCLWTVFDVVVPPFLVV